MSRTGSLARRLAPLDPRNWRLSVRVVAATVVLSLIAIISVGGYLSSRIADGLFEQRRERVLADALAARDELLGVLRSTAGKTDTQRQDALTALIRTLPSRGAAGSRQQALLIPARTDGGVSAISTDPTVGALVGRELTASLSRTPESISYRSVAIPTRTGTEPGLVAGVRVAIAGSIDYDLFLLYSFEQEAQTLELVQRTMAGGAVVLLGLIVGIALLTARIVALPLSEVAGAAERIAAGDLTSRVRATGSDDLARVGRSFNEMADNLQQKIDDLVELSEIQRRFVSDVSHELRTPLTTIRMASSMLDASRAEFPPEIARTTELLVGQVARFETLLADLLEISRFDAGAAQLDAQPHDLVALVRRAIGDLAVFSRDRERPIVLVPQRPQIPVVVDARRIDRILRNLLTNAVEHGDDRGTLVLVSGDADMAAVVVEDFGAGLDPETARRVFDRFWRADPSRARVFGGTGLGLAISLEDARLHGGELEAWGRPGRGAVFRLTIPRRPGPGGRSPIPLVRDLDADAALLLEQRSAQAEADGTDGAGTAHDDPSDSREGEGR